MREHHHGRRSKEAQKRCLPTRAVRRRWRKLVVLTFAFKIFRFLEKQEGENIVPLMRGNNLFDLALHCNIRLSSFHCGPPAELTRGLRNGLRTGGLQKTWQSILSFIFSPVSPTFLQRSQEVAILIISHAIYKTVHTPLQMF